MIAEVPGAESVVLKQWNVSVLGCLLEFSSDMIRMRARRCIDHQDSQRSMARKHRAGTEMNFPKKAGSGFPELWWAS